MTEFDSPRLRRFAAGYDRMNSLAERGWLGAARASLVGGLTGTVLEIGAGTGANVPHYRAATRVIAAEPSPAMRERLEARLGEARVPVEIVGAPAGELPVADNSVDVVVSTLVFCSVDDLDEVLAEIRRVLTPSGRLVFLEHIRGGPIRGALQDLFTPLWSRFGAGCRPNRAIVEAIRRASFDVRQVKTFKPRLYAPITKPRLGRPRPEPPRAGCLFARSMSPSTRCGTCSARRTRSQPDRNRADRDQPARHARTGLRQAPRRTPSARRLCSPTPPRPCSGTYISAIVLVGLVLNATPQLESSNRGTRSGSPPTPCSW